MIEHLCGLVNVVIVALLLSELKMFEISSVLLLLKKYATLCQLHPQSSWPDRCNYQLNLCKELTNGSFFKYYTCTCVICGFCLYPPCSFLSVDVFEHQNPPVAYGPCSGEEFPITSSRSTHSLNDLAMTRRRTITGMS